MKRLLTIFSLILLNKLYGQIPIGFSSEFIPIESLLRPSSTGNFKQLVKYYKPSNYNPSTSPLVFVNHGIGGTGFTAVSSFQDIADRRGALLVGLYFDSAGVTMSHQGAFVSLNLDTNNTICTVTYSPTEVLKTIYRRILEHENRTEMPSYMIGFSAGGQFANRYNVHRQIYPDSIPFKMIVSSNAYAYMFPTDTLNGVAMSGAFGFAPYDSAPLPYCLDRYNFYNYKCQTHIEEFYRSNYGILVGTADTVYLEDFAQGDNRYERAVNLYNFGLTDSQQQGLEFNWHYREVLGIGHDDWATYHAVENVGDVITIAEALLFDSPYVEPINISPTASFKVSDKWGSYVSFLNMSSNENSFYWDFGDGQVSTEENPTHHYTVPGTFTVQLTVNKNEPCKNWYFIQNIIEITLEDIQSIENGISENEENESFVVYPNPNKGHFFLKNNNFKGKEKEFTYILYDINGKIVKQEKAILTSLIDGNRFIEKIAVQK
jgi:hypothetical protein